MMSSGTSSPAGPFLPPGFFLRVVSLQRFSESITRRAHRAVKSLPALCSVDAVEIARLLMGGNGDTSTTPRDFATEQKSVDRTFISRVSFNE
ncbi:hypothetical protein EYF80_024911 [Liparis tanakae]|uniref:Uncharacterized protein n=1 Tax=Liparis tanakae TaxID=230148 RepID=A0A4Z2HIZ3_9TELE|nr:hypothetical protein EYF80_024911 [Liparis tanakae]